MRIAHSRSKIRTEPNTRISRLITKSIYHTKTIYVNKKVSNKRKTRNKQRNTHPFYLILSFLKNHFPTGFQRKNKASHPLKTQIPASEPEHQDVLSKISGCLQANIKVFFEKRQGVFRQSPSPPTPSTSLLGGVSHSLLLRNHFQMRQNCGSTCFCKRQIQCFLTGKVQFSLHSDNPDKTIPQNAGRNIFSISIVFPIFRHKTNF